MEPSSGPSVSGVADDLFRREGARLVATLTAHLGTHRLQLAEDVVQEALVRALQTWPYRGIPENPAAWLTLTAKNLALDILRREQRWKDKEDSIGAEQERWLASPQDELSNDHAIVDDTLRMLFVCFHPQLSTEAQMALALRTVCGLSPAEIAAAFLSSEAAVSKRLVRARQRIRELALPFAVPSAAELPERLNGVLTALYLLFNEGYKATSGERLVREELCREAIRLTSLLTQYPSTSQPQTFALLALMQFNASRLPARTNHLGHLLRLHEQDRATWDHALISQGMQSLAQATTGEVVSLFHLKAGISACHCLSLSDEMTDWSRILSLYDQLLLLAPSPVTAMNRIVAVWKVHGARQALMELSAIPTRHSLESSHFYHAIKATLHSVLAQWTEARASFVKARDLSALTAERDFIENQLAQLPS